MRPDPDALITATQAALHLKVRVHTVYMWVNRGNLKVAEVRGTRKLYRLADVLAAEKATRASVRERGGRRRQAA